jgi:hypothetical protein
MEIKIHANNTVPKGATLIKFTEQDFDNVMISDDGVKTIYVGAGKEPNTRRKLILLFRKIVSLAKTSTSPTF